MTEEHCVSVWVPASGDGVQGMEDVRKVVEPGRGIAYGNRMCEYHEGMEDLVREATEHSKREARKESS